MKTVITILFLIIVASGTLLYIFERGENGQIVSIWDGLWLAATTASSVGYGDVYPVTVGGRILSALLGFVGLCSIGVTSALFTSYFLQGRTPRSKG